MKNIFRRKPIKGGIDFICTSHISGWVFSDKYKIKSVRLYSSNKLLSEKKLEIFRDDINKKFLNQGNYGFKIELYYDYLANKNSNIKVKALLEGGKELKLQYMPNPRKTDDYLKYCLSGNHLGMIGNIDEYNSKSKYLEGWAFNKTKDNFNPAIIWIQSEGSEPIMVKCDKSRNDLGINGIPKNCGFKINLNSLPKDLFEKKISLTFDFEGRFTIFCNNNNFNLTLGKSKNKSLSKNYEITESSPYYEDIKNVSKELKTLWIETENFRQYLENIENSIDIIESKKLVEAKKKLKKGILHKFFKRFSNL